MSSIFDNTDDLDPNFNVDPDILKNSDNNKNQNDTDTVIVTKAEKPLQSVKATNTPSMNELLEAKLVVVQDDTAKVTKLQDIHDAIVAQESIGRLDAENISEACEDFLGPRLKLNGFTTTPSSINYQHSKNFLSRKIAMESEKIKATIKTIATEDVMQYTSSILEKVKNRQDGHYTVAHDKLDSLKKGIYVQNGKEMINVASIKPEELKAIAETASMSQDLREAIAAYWTEVCNTRIMKFIALRQSGLCLSDAVIGMSTQSANEFELSIDSLGTYVKDMYTVDMDSIINNGYLDKDGYAAVIETISGSVDNPVEFIKVAREAIGKFKQIEAYEELLVCLPLSVKVMNAIIEACKYD